MKKILTLALLCLACGWAVAQNLEVRHSDYSYLQLHYQGATLEVGETTLLGETFSTVSLPNAFSTLTPGAPALPMVTSLIEVPLCEGFEVTVTPYSGDTLTGLLPHPVVPAQPSRSKSDRSQPRLVMDRQLYQQDAFLGGDFCQVERVGVARSKNLARVQFCPVQYNPVTGQLTEMKEAVVTIRFRQPDLQATRDLARHATPSFAPQTLNQLPCSKDIASAQTAPIHYLIVAHPMFRGELDEFVAWKQRKGFLVTVAYTDQPEVGTTPTAIASYIKGFYTNASDELPAPSFLLLVGDHGQLPAHNGRWDYGSQSPNQQITDLYYATWTEGDMIPDCYYGRFSAENVGQLTPQVEKTLMYEQYTFSDPSFLDRAILVAGVDNGSPSDNGYRFGDPAMDYAAKYYVTPQRFPGGVTYYKNNTSFAPAGVTVTGSSQATANAATLRQLYSEGAGWINYTAHGDVTEWYQPSFTNSHVAQMTNHEKFGFMIGNCCLTGKFDQTCLGEALLRKDGYCGAVEYFGGSNVTYWYEDFYWSVGARNGNDISNTMDATYDAQNQGMYDRLFHTQDQPRSDWYITAGAMMMAGNLAVEASGSGGRQYYWEVYHNFGDPSVMPYHGQAQPLPLQAATSMPIGTASLMVTAVPYAYCAVTDGQGTLIGAAFADATGQALVPTSDINAPGDYELAATAQGYQPAFQPLTVHVLDGPFVKVNSIEATLVAGEQAAISVEIENVGTQATEQLSVELIVDGHHLFLHQPGQQTLSNLAAEHTTTVSGLFTADVLPTVADQTRTQVTAIVRWSTWNIHSSRRTATLTVDAPALAVTGHTLSGEPQPGTELELEVNLTNEGHAATSHLQATLLSLEPSIHVSQPMQGDTSWSIAPGQNGLSRFTLTIDSTLPSDCVIPLFYILRDQYGQRLEHTVNIALGQGSMETFESGDLEAFDWQQGQYPWEITTNTPFAGAYSARSKTWSNSYWGGSNGNNCTTDMQIEWTGSVDDSISFHYKVSSENNYDFFRFYIDGQQMMQASGEVDWTRAAYPVTAGTHTFRFAYDKDYSQRSGSDCAWVDNITFPLVGTARVYGLDTVCQGESYDMATYTIDTDTLTPGNHLFTDSADHLLQHVMLTVVATPELSLTADHSTIRAGESALLTVGGAMRYLWSTGETTSQLRVYPRETTEYSVTGYNGRCQATASITITVDGTIGIAEAQEQPSLSLYPNPTTGMVHIATTSDEPLRLYDVRGRLLSTFNSQLSTLNLESLPKGIYLLRQGCQVQKVVKQ